MNGTLNKFHVDWVHLEDESGRYYGNGRTEIDPIPEPLLWAVSFDIGMSQLNALLHYLNIITCHELAHHLGEAHLGDGLTWNIQIEKGLTRRE